MFANIPSLLSRYKQEAQALQNQSNAIVFTVSSSSSNPQEKAQQALEAYKKLQPKLDRLKTVNASLMDRLQLICNEQASLPKIENENSSLIQEASCLQETLSKMSEEFQTHLSHQCPDLKVKYQEYWISQTIQTIAAERSPHSPEPFALRLERFKHRASLLNTTCKETLKTLHEQPHNVDSARQTFNRIDQKLNGLIIANSFLREQIHEPSSETLNPLFFESLTLTEGLEKIRKTFVDWFLTLYPDAEIFYGESCISPRKQSTPENLWASLFSNYRDIRGDGNCFYFSMAVALLESTKIQDIRNLLLDHPEWISPGKDTAVELLNESIRSPQLIEELLGDNRKILCMVNLLRKIAGHEIRHKKEKYSPFIADDFDSHIRLKVELMGQPADHCAILALCDALDFPIVIYDINTNCQMHLGDEKKSPLATLCRQDEHYFIAYRDDRTMKSSR